MTEIEELITDWEMWDDIRSQVKYSFPLSVRTRARTLLMHYGLHSLESVCRKTAKELMRVKGLGSAQALYIRLLLNSYGLDLGMDGDIPSVKEALGFRHRRRIDANGPLQNRNQNTC